MMFSLWALVPVAGAIGLFTFLAVAVWADARRQERQTYYQYEFRKRLVDAGKLDAKELETLILQEARIAAERTSSGMRAAGVIMAGAGVGLLAGLRFIEDADVWMVGFIPLSIGLGMLVYSVMTGSRSGAAGDGGSR